MNGDENDDPLDGDWLGGNWWPYGPLAEALANAVLEDNQEKVAHYVGRIKDEKAKAAEFGRLEHLFSEEIDQMRWDNAKALLEEMRMIGGLTESAIVRLEWTLSIESSYGVLDRLSNTADPDAEA